MSPRDGAAVADNPTSGDREKVDVSSVQPRASGKPPEQVDWSFKVGLLRFHGRYEQAEEMQLQALGLRGRCWARSILTH